MNIWHRPTKQKRGAVLTFYQSTPFFSSLFFRPFCEPIDLLDLLELHFVTLPTRPSGKLTRLHPAPTTLTQGPLLDAYGRGAGQGR